MGFFDDLDEDNWDDVNDDPDFVPDNDYRCILSDVKTIENEDRGTESLLFQYTIIGGEYEGQTAAEWFVTNDPELTMEQLKHKLSYLKRRLNSLQVSIGDFKNSKGQCLVGKKVIVAIKNNTKGDRTFRNVRSVSLDTGDTVGSAFDL